MTKMLKVVGASWLQTKISSYVLGTLGVLAIVAIFLGELERIQDDGNYAATVFYSEKTGYHIEYWGQSNDLGSLKRGVARAYYRQDIATTGWAQLEIETDGSYKDKVQAYAAGLLEGALTWQSVHAHLLSARDAQCARAPRDCDRVRDQLERAASIDKKNAAIYEDDQPFWHQVGLFYEQIDGIYTGWHHGVKRSQNYDESMKIEKADLYWLNAMSEIREIKKFLNISVHDEINDQLPGLSSAFIRIVNETTTEDHVTNTRRKLFVAHNTAGSYNSMVRILKRYKLNYHQTDAWGSPLVPVTTVQFPGYPAAVTSHDDMSVLSGEGVLLAVTGTAINNFNAALWRKVNIVDQVPIGPRVSAANRLATNVSKWVHVVASNNSGTACKQWMVVDFTMLDKLDGVRARTVEAAPARSDDKAQMQSERVYINSVNGHTNSDHAVTYTIENNNVKHTVLHRGAQRVKGLFWLLEQIPGSAHSGDLSEALLRNGYWATYGLPYFKDIANHTHLPERENQYGSIFSYDNSPRAKLFQEAAPNATTVDYILRFMRNNNVSLLHKSTAKDSDAKKVDETNKMADAVNETADEMDKEKVACSDGTVVADVVECLLNEGTYWMNLAVRGDLAHQYKQPFGVIDSKVFSGYGDGIDEFAAVSGPSFTTKAKETSKASINKGNVALTSANSKELTTHSKHIQPTEDEAASQIVTPFQWSTSMFSKEPHDVQPDTWAFQPFQPKWVW